MKSTTLVGNSVVIIVEFAQAHKNGREEKCP